MTGGILFLPSEAFPDLSLIRQLFDSVGVIHVETDRRRYRAIVAGGFDFEAYKSVVMAPVIENFYDNNPFASRVCFIDRYR